MADPFIGEIRMFGGNFPPQGWAFCNGQLLSVTENPPLFALLGTTYGGDGTNTFALPDLRGRLPLHQGGGHTLGQPGGAEAVTLTTAQIPSHTHTWQASPAPSEGTDPRGALLGGADIYSAPNARKAVLMAPSTIGATGGSQPHDNVQPYQCLSFIIALQGIYPVQG